MAKKIIYIKYSELTLKGKNRLFFIKQLYKNLKFAFNSISLKLDYYFDYMTIEDFNDTDLVEITNVLKNTPGIHSFCTAHVIEKDLTVLESVCFEIIQEKIKTSQLSTFRITCSRQDKSFNPSSEIINLLAAKILKNTNLKVDLKNFDINLQIEVKKDKIFIFTDYENACNGLPIGSSGTCLVLLSGGIDSPVAARLLMLRGLKVDFLTFITPPHTSDQALQKVRDLAKTITMNNKISQSNLYVCNFTPIQHEISHIKKESYRITLMRRQFFSIAKNLALKNNISCIATGESLGQVASQTIESMAVISEVLKDFLIIRPLIALDKQEIIQLANKFQTYEISILPYDDSCSLFAPKHPVTKPNLKEALRQEQSCYLLNGLTDQAINNYVWKEELVDGEYQKIHG